MKKVLITRFPASQPRSVSPLLHKRRVSTRGLFNRDSKQHSPAPDLMCVTQRSSTRPAMSRSVSRHHSPKPSLREALTPAAMRHPSITTERRPLMVAQYDTWRKQSLREKIKLKLMESPRRSLPQGPIDPLKRAKDQRKENIEFMVGNALSVKLKPLSVYLITAEESCLLFEVLTARKSPPLSIMDRIPSGDVEQDQAIEKEYEFPEKDYQYYFEDMRDIVRYLVKKGVFKSQDTAQFFSLKGRRVALEDEEIEDVEEGLVRTYSSTRSLSPGKVKIWQLDQVVILERPVHNRQTGKYIEEKKQNLRSMLELLEEMEEKKRKERQEKELLKKEENTLQANKKYKILKLTMQRQEGRHKAILGTQAVIAKPSPPDKQVKEADASHRASLLPELPNQLQLTPNSRFRRFFRFSSDALRQSSPAELSQRRPSEPMPPAKSPSTFMRRYGTSKPNIPVRQIQKGQTYNFEDLAQIFSVHYNSEKFSQVLKSRFGEKKMQREADQRYIRSPLRSTVHGQQILNSMVAQNHSRSKSPSFRSSYKKEIIKNFSSLDALSPAKLSPAELSHSLQKKPVLIKHTVGNFLTCADAGGKVAIGKNPHYCLIMTKYKSDFSLIEHMLRHFFLFKKLQDQFYREGCDFQKAMGAVLLSEDEFSHFIQHLNASFRIVRTVVVKHFHKRLRMTSQIYFTKVLSALQVHYPDECLSFNDYARICYFMLDRKATTYQKLTIVARLIAQLGEEPELSQFIKLLQMALQTSAQDHKLISAIVDNLVAHKIVDSKAHLDLNIFLAVYGKQDLNIHDLYEILI